MQTYINTLLYTYIYLLMNMHTLIFILPDIDECSDGTQNCSQTCTNTPGSFICGCYNSGFLLDNDGFTCNGMYKYNLYVLLVICWRWEIFVVKHFNYQ